jgi:hypothetical protein
MANNIKLEFGINEKWFNFDFVNATRKYNTTYINFYAYKDYCRCKTELKALLLKANTLKEVENELNKRGFYLYLFRRYTPNINYFFIVRNLDKNKMIYDNKATLMYINDNINVINNDNVDELDNIKNDIFDDLD